MGAAVNIRLLYPGHRDGWQTKSKTERRRQLKGCLLPLLGLLKVRACAHQSPDTGTVSIGHPLYPMALTVAQEGPV
jgi:hypothetical protein